MITISIDDFGTGYSSLSYLSRLSVQELKIDRAFVQDMLTNRDNAVLVQTIITMAHALDCIVVAEGIEDEPTLARLLELGCDVGQGYYISKPVPADEFPAWMNGAGWAIGRTAD